LTDKERLLQKTHKTKSCWIFNGAKSASGVGQIYYSKIKTKMSAHRLSHILFIGEIPKCICVCHKCDVPSCVNPNHLFLGTHSDNMKDCAKKGRSNLQKDPHNKKKKQCARGHWYRGKNLIILP